MQTETDTQVLAALLDWYREMGADTAVAESTVNWLERGDAAPGHTFRLPESEARARPEAEARAPETRARPAAGPSQSVDSPKNSAPPRASFQAPQAAPRFDARPPFSATPPDAAEIAARTAAGKAESLEQLEAALRTFDGCGLKATAKNLCFYRGAARARLMIVGEAPGREEDLEGKPFVGRAGQLLDKMLAALSLSEADVHITNVVYWRPPGNRTPTPQESQVCRPFLERQMELVEPDVVLLLGGAAAKQVLDVAEGIMRIRGKWREIKSGQRTVKTMATLHPAYLLRTPAAKRHAWRDLLAVEAALGKTS
ncbi:uracil-DNA glycosylase [Hyphomicrobium sp. LHD-15]|uniref:uracil-DNA glycosylase n=1 Tax=Hyphomicrobium sp. LHD-15 TaxID=3072142 RepID=UPI00280D9D41|nr:uracil-DNA glycosylase [Hyphomicrobium sp. LHD-15]MDQ8699387.1 uracil-DNA glycosylase [Hyphomicrobium sp. LHD-15]